MKQLSTRCSCKRSDEVAIHVGPIVTPPCAAACVVAACSYSRVIDTASPSLPLSLSLSLSLSLHAMTDVLSQPASSQPGEVSESQYEETMDESNVQGEVSSDMVYDRDSSRGARMLIHGCMLRIHVHHVMIHEYHTCIRNLYT